MVRVACLIGWMLAPALALAIECDDVPALAEEIAGQRDVEAAAGLARAEESLALLRAGQNGCPVGEALLLRAKASNLHILGRADEALRHVKDGLELLEGAKPEEAEHRAALNLTAGVLYWELEAHDDAIAHYLVALEASQAAGDELGAARAAGNIGNLYNTMGELDLAREYHLASLAGFERAGVVIGQAGARVNLAALAGRVGSHERELGKETAAMEAFNEMLEQGRMAMALFEQADNPRGRAYAANNIAAALEGLDRPGEALEYHHRALILQQGVGDIAGALQTLLTMSDAYRRIGRLELASEALDQAADRVPEGSLARGIEVAQRRVELAELRGDYRSALEYQKELTSLRRQIAERQMTARVEEVRLAMQAAQREGELALLRSEAEIAELQLRRQRATILAAALLAILLLGSLVLLFIRYRSRVRVSRQLDRDARTDLLTGLSNRRDLVERLTVAHAQCRRTGEAQALILADIDNFKEINDSHGHAVGDEVLWRLADILNAAVRRRDTVARWGGEEFLLLLPDTDLDGALAVAESLREAVRATPIRTAVGDLALTLTMGVTELTADKSIELAVSEADEALYRGKRAGKDRAEPHAAEG